MFHTDRHTDRQTDRQTDETKLIAAFLQFCERTQKVIVRNVTDISTRALAGDKYLVKLGRLCVFKFSFL